MSEHDESIIGYSYGPNGGNDYIPVRRFTEEDQIWQDRAHMLVALREHLRELEQVMDTCPHRVWNDTVGFMYTERCCLNCGKSLEMI